MTRFPIDIDDVLAVKTFSQWLEENHYRGRWYFVENGLDDELAELEEQFIDECNAEGIYPETDEPHSQWRG